MAAIVDKEAKRLYLGPRELATSGALFRQIPKAVSPRAHYELKDIIEDSEVLES